MLRMRRLVSPDMSAYIRRSTNNYLEKYLKTIDETNGTTLVQNRPKKNNVIVSPIALVFPIAFCLFYFLQKRSK